MRFLIVVLAVLGLAAGSAALAPTVAAAEGGDVLALDQQPGGGGLQGQVDIDITERTAGGGWWADPVWIGVGIVALVLLVVIVALATRGGGTTVIRE